MTTGEDLGEQELRASIETLRLVLKKARPQDDAGLTELLTRPGVAEGLAGLPGSCRDDIGERFVVVERASGEPIGAAIYGPDADRPAAVHIACWFHEDDWGHGYATEALHAVIDRAFANERVDRVWCTNRVTNARARRVVEKCGFQFREVGMARAPMQHGTVPVERFVLDRRNWVALKSWGTPAVRKSGREENHDAAA